MATENLGWIVRCDSCRLVHDVEGKPTSAEAVAAAVANGWTSERVKEGASWRRRELCRTCNGTETVTPIAPEAARAAIQEAGKQVQDAAAANAERSTAILGLVVPRVRDEGGVEIRIKTYPHVIVHAPAGGILERCSSCDPSFACFSKPVTCVKTIPAAAMKPGPNASWQCGRCMGVFELAGGALEHTEFECEANQARGVR